MGNRDKNEKKWNRTTNIVQSSEENQTWLRSLTEGEEIKGFPNTKFVEIYLEI